MKNQNKKTLDFKKIKCFRSDTNYQKRQQAGKSVGSGKAEITVNQVVGMRQKKKGMSWTPRGSYALGVIKTFQLNGQFNQFWNHKKAA